MKKLIALLLALVMVFGLMACAAREEAPVEEEDAVVEEAPVAAEETATDTAPGAETE